MRHIQILLLLIITTSLNSFAQDEQSADGDPIIKQQNFLGKNLKAQKLASLVSIDPGDSVEGDYIKESTFYNNGQKLLVTNFVSQNLSIIDWASQQVEANIPLGAGPVNVKVHNNIALVSLPLADSVAVIDLLTNTLINKISTPGEPNTIKIDELNNRALVASIDSQYCYVIDLNTSQITHIIDSFYSSIQSFSFITSNNRSDFSYYDFLLSPNGSKALSISADGSGISIHDVNSGNIDSTYNQISNAFSMLMTDSSRAFILNNGSVPALYRIDMNTLSMDSLLLSGQTIFTLCKGMAADASGESIILSLGSGLVKVDYDMQSLSPVGSNTAFWLESSFDNQFAVAGGFYTQVIDIANGTMAGSYTGLSQSKGAVSDSAYHFIGVDPLRKEYLHSFDFSTGTNLIGNISTGSQLEADASYRVAFSDDGTDILVANQLSTTASIIDADSMKTKYLVPGMATGSFGCAITSDGKFGLIADYEGFAIHVIHMETGTLVASPAVGDRPSIIRIAPGDTLALVTNTRGNTVSFVRLDSANSANIGNLSVGVIGVSWTNQGIFSDLQIPSVGNFALLAASFDDEIKVIDMINQNIVASIPTGDFPSQISIADNGQFALTINKNDNTVSFLNVQGGFSSVLNVANTANNPTRITYNKNTDQFIVCNSGSSSAEFFNGQNGNLLSTSNFGPNYTPIQAEVLSNGKIAYLLVASGSNTTHALRVDGIDYPLPARPCYMDASKNGNKIAIAMSGPDYVSIYEGDSLTSIEANYLSSQSSIKLFPNPGGHFLNLRLGKKRSGMFSIYNVRGINIEKGSFLNENEIQIDLETYESGIYFIEIINPEINQTLRFIKR